MLQETNFPDALATLSLSERRKVGPYQVKLRPSENGLNANCPLFGFGSFWLLKVVRRHRHHLLPILFNAEYMNRVLAKNLAS